MSLDTFAETTAGKQRGKPFQRGETGNPSGRPKGARNKATLAMEALLDGEAESLTRKAIELAMSGDGPALRMCMDRLLPARRDRAVNFALPKLETAADAVKANAALVEAVADGELTPSEAAELAKLVEGFTRSVGLHDIQARLDKLEQQQEGKRR